MQVNTYHTKNNNFRALKINTAQKSQVRDFLEREIVKTKDKIQLNSFIESQKNNTNNIYLSTSPFTRSVNEVFNAEIGDYKFISKHPLKAIKKAIRIADDIKNDQISVGAKTETISSIINKIV